MAKTNKKAVGIALAGVMSIASVSGVVNSMNTVVVNAAESKALKDAKAKISHLTYSLKNNYLGIKNQGQWEIYVKEARVLIAKIPKAEAAIAKELTEEVDRDASMIQGLARINKVEKSMETNFHGIKNAKQWNEYLTLAVTDLSKVDQKVFEKQYEELVQRLDVCAKEVATIEEQFNIEYKFALSLYEEAVSKNDLAKAQAALVAAEKLGTCDESDKLEENCKKLIDELTNSVAAVLSAEIVNGNEITIKFNKEVVNTKVAEAVKLGDITFKLSEESSDNKTFTLTSSKVIDVKDAVLTIEPVETKANASVKTEKYIEVVSYKDITAPTVKSVIAKGGAAVITFNEKILSGATLSLNGVNYSNIDIDGKTLTINSLEVGKTYDVQIVGARDISGNLSNPINLKFTVEKADEEGTQTVSSAVNENKVTLKFSNAISAVNTAKVVFKDGKALNTDATALVLNGKDSDGVIYSSDKKTITIDAQALKVMTGITFLNTEMKVVAVGQKNDAFFDVSLTSDTKPAKLVSVEMPQERKMILSFDEVVNIPTEGEINLKVLAVDGIYQSAPELWKNCNISYAVDKDGKAIKNKLEITLPSLALFNKTYTLEVPAGISDIYGNVAGAFNVIVSVKEDGNVNPESKILATTEVNKRVIKISFTGLGKDKWLTDEAAKASNYTLGGEALPYGSIVRFIDDKSHVEIILPEDSIKTDGSYMLKMKNIQDEVGNTLAKGEDSKVVSLVENITPKATSLVVSSSENIVITFSEAVKVSSTDGSIGGVTLKVNDRAITGATLKLDSEGKTLTISSVSVKSSDKIQVEFKNSGLVDKSKNENQIKDMTVSN